MREKWGKHKDHQWKVSDEAGCYHKEVWMLEWKFRWGMKNGNTLENQETTWALGEDHILNSSEGFIKKQNVF